MLKSLSQLIPTLWKQFQYLYIIYCKLLSLPSFKEPSLQEVRVNPRCLFNDIVFWIIGAYHYINKLSPIWSFYFMSQYWILTLLRSTPKYFLKISAGLYCPRPAVILVNNIFPSATGIIFPCMLHDESRP